MPPNCFAKPLTLELHYPDLAQILWSVLDDAMRTKPTGVAVLASVQRLPQATDLMMCTESHWQPGINHCSLMLLHLQKHLAIGTCLSPPGRLFALVIRASKL